MTAAVIAAEEGRDLDALSWLHERGLALATSATLRHRVACNGFFAALMREARLKPDGSLVAWWSAWRCAKQWGRLARPDGYAVWIETGVRLPFLLEYDRGTESGKRLADKLPGYRDLLKVSLPPTWLLFCFESPRREVEARKVAASARQRGYRRPVAKAKSCGCAMAASRRHAPAAADRARARSNSCSTNGRMNDASGITAR